MPRRKAPIRQLASGRYQIRRRGPDGRERGGTFDTEREAYDHLVKMEADQRRGTYIDPADASTLFADYARSWLSSHPGAPRTLSAIRGSLEVHLIPAVGSVPLSQLRFTQLQAVISRLPKAPGTVKLVLQHLNQVLNGAVADRMIPVNPARGIRLPRSDPAELVIPTPAEVRGVLEAINERSRALVIVGAGLGLRQGECFGLAKDRVDFLRRQVTVDRQLVTLNEGCVLAPPKTPRSVRTVPMSTNVTEELARHLERFPSDDPDGLIFTTRLGSRIRHNGWNQRTWKPAVAAVGRPELTFHCTRHFYASALIRKGQSPVVVARRLGNSAAMVMSTYAHLWHDDDDRSREAIDDILTVGHVDTVGPEQSA